MYIVHRQFGCKITKHVCMYVTSQDVAQLVVQLVDDTSTTYQSSWSLAFSTSWIHAESWKCCRRVFAKRSSSFVRFYAPQLYRQVGLLLRRALATGILPVCPSVCHDPVVYQDQVR